jgi:hypothetical protein
MNKNILATTLSMGVVGIAFGVFWAATPPMKTGGISYLSAMKIESQVDAIKQKLVIDRARDAEGSLSAKFIENESDHNNKTQTPLLFKTDASGSKPADGETLVITSTIGTQATPDKSDAVMSTMLFKGKNKPSLVFTINGDLPLALAKSALTLSKDELGFNGCLTVANDSATQLERSVTLDVNCNLQLGYAVDFISFNNWRLLQLSKLTQSFILQTGAINNLTSVVSPKIADDGFMFRKGATINVYYKADPAAMDRGINFVYKPVE